MILCQCPLQPGRGLLVQQTDKQPLRPRGHPAEATTTWRPAEGTRWGAYERTTEAHLDTAFFILEKSSGADRALMKLFDDFGSVLKIGETFTTSRPVMDVYWTGSSVIWVQPSGWGERYGDSEEKRERNGQRESFSQGPNKREIKANVREWWSVVTLIPSVILTFPLFISRPFCPSVFLSYRHAYRDQAGGGDRPQADRQRVGWGVEAPWPCKKSNNIFLLLYFTVLSLCK